MLKYREAGQGQAVLLVHGNFAGKDWWREVLSQAPAGYRFIAPDLPGFGESPAPEGFTPSIPFYAEALEGFAEALEARNPVLVGHSLGAAVVMEAALRDPARYPALVLVAPAPPDGYPTPEAYYPVLASYRTDRAGLAQALRGIMPGRTPPYFEALVDLAQGMHPAGFEGNARALAAWSAAGRTGAYRGPVLVVWGTQDTLIPRAMAEATARAFPGGRLVVLEGVGHSPMLEAPERFVEVLEGFLQEVGG